MTVSLPYKILVPLLIVHHISSCISLTNNLPHPPNKTILAPARILSARKSAMDDDCSALPRKNSSIRLYCYQCESDLRDKEPSCDNHLWRHLRHSQKYRMRIQCGESSFYCMKLVRQKLGVRLTQRGCVGDDRTQWKEGYANHKEGCVTYSKDGYLNTVCFCKESLCNRATDFSSGATASLLRIAILITCLHFFWDPVCSGS